MKRAELERHLRAHRCAFVRHGSGHDIWRNEAGDRRTSIPRHRQLALGTCRAICRQLGLPMP
ncbi:MAG: type II toxin-antitoxin system HicA family toxin [Planctomycetes bacterium]|nr:type II toxin-antitoxin system HicA family toxin [Planctomycetota bacterium]